VATKAMAAKLARLIYRMLRFGMQFVDQGAVYEAAYHQREIHHLERKAATLGFQIIEAASRRGQPGATDLSHATLWRVSAMSKSV
jgi:hypothetical protein